MNTGGVTGGAPALCQVLHDQIHLNSRAGPRGRFCSSHYSDEGTEGHGDTGSKWWPRDSHPRLSCSGGCRTFPSDEEESEAQGGGRDTDNLWLSQRRSLALPFFVQYWFFCALWLDLSFCIFPAAQISVLPRGSQAGSSECQLCICQLVTLGKSSNFSTSQFVRIR